MSELEKANMISMLVLYLILFAVALILLLAISKEILDLMRYYLETQNMMKGKEGNVKGKEKEKRKKFRTDPVKGRTEFSGSHAKYAKKEESS
jgi:hypothetical protein